MQCGFYLKMGSATVLGQEWHMSPPVRVAQWDLRVVSPPPPHKNLCKLGKYLYLHKIYFAFTLVNLLVYAWQLA